MAKKDLKSLKPKSPGVEKSLKTFTVKNINWVLGKDSENVMFSFQFFDRFEEKCFNLGGAIAVCDNWFVSLLDVFKEISACTVTQAKQDPKFDMHPHDFSKTNFIYKIFEDKTMEQLDCCQFQLSKSKGRVHGFQIDHIFYVYWLDPNHQMYDVEGHGTYKTYKYKPLQDCFEKITETNIELMKENQKLIKENKEIWNMLDQQAKNTNAINQ